MNYETMTEFFKIYNAGVNIDSYQGDSSNEQELFSFIAEKSIEYIKSLQTILKDNVGIFEEEIYSDLNSSFDGFINLDYKSEINTSIDQFSEKWKKMVDVLKQVMGNSFDDYLDKIVKDVENGDMTKEQAKLLISKCGLIDEETNKFNEIIDNVVVEEDLTYLSDISSLMISYSGLDSNVLLSDDLELQYNALKNYYDKFNFLNDINYADLGKKLDSDLIIEFNYIVNKLSTSVLTLKTEALGLKDSPTEVNKKAYEKALEDYKKAKEDFSKNFKEVSEAYCKLIVSKFEKGKLGFEKAMSLIQISRFSPEITGKYIEILMNKQLEQSRDEKKDDVEKTDSTGQQSIGNNEGSLENQNSTESTLEQEIDSIQLNSNIKYGAAVEEKVSSFNIENEQKRIAKLKELQAKNGKLSIMEALELRTLVARSELRKKSESKIIKGGDFVLTGISKRVENTSEKVNIQEQKTNAAKGKIAKFISGKKLGMLQTKLAILQNMQGALANIQVNTALMSQSISSKLLTARVVGKAVASRFKSVKGKVLSRLKKDDNPIIIVDTPADLTMQGDSLSLSSSITR